MKTPKVLYNWYVYAFKLYTRDLQPTGWRPCWNFPRESKQYISKTFIQSVFTENWDTMNTIKSVTCIRLTAFRRSPSVTGGNGPK